MANLILGTPGDDILEGTTGDDRIEAGDGDDLIDDSLGSNTLIGGAGRDVILGRGTIEGGTGDDLIYATDHGSADTYVFALGDGADTILENGSGPGTGGTEIDVLRLGPGIAPDMVTLARIDQDLRLRIGASDSITFAGWFTGGAAQIEQVEFDDGTVWRRADLLAWPIEATGTDQADMIDGWQGADRIDAGAGDDTVRGDAGHDTVLGGAGDDFIEGGAGDDRLHGGDGRDTLDGGTGADLLDGGAGDDRLAGRGTFVGGTGDDTLVATDLASSDVYEHAAGDGHDRIVETGYEPASDGSGRDILTFGPGLDAASATLSRQGDDLVIGLGERDSVTVQDWFLGAVHRLEEIRFADGTVWTPATVAARPVPMTGTAGDDFITGWDGADRIDAAGGHDQVESAGGDDSVSGGEGRDTLDGGAGNDTLDGGAGDDLLRDAEGANVLRGGAGQDRLEGRGTFDGGAGDDTMVALDPGSADTYVHQLGDGMDTLVESGNGPAQGVASLDVLSFGQGISAASVGVTRDGDDLVLRIAEGDGVRLRDWYLGSVQQIEEIRFADGTVWTPATLQARPVSLTGTDGDDRLIGTAGSDSLDGGLGRDTLDGQDGDDVLDGGDGDDVLEDRGGMNLLRGGAGHDLLTGRGTMAGGTGDDRLVAADFYVGDTYRFERGDGRDTIDDEGQTGGDASLADRLVFGTGIDAASVALRREGDALVLDAGGGDRVTVAGWYVDATRRLEQIVFADGTTWSQADLRARPIAMTGTGEGDAITGWDGMDVIDGAAGADTIEGGAGADTVDGGAGDDRLTDAQGANLLRGGAGDDRITGRGTMEGGAGDDLLVAADPESGDTYLFRAGDGRDRITDVGSAGTDILAFGDGIAAAALALSREGDDLVLASGATDRVTLAGWFAEDGRQIEEIRFQDGTTWGVDTLRQRTLALAGTAGADTLRGWSGADALDGLGGDDRLDGLAGQDQLAGGAGRDTLDGGEGDDRLDGGDGDDVLDDALGANTLDGGAGQDRLTGRGTMAGGTGDDLLVAADDWSADTYLFRIGDGHDRIEDHGQAPLGDLQVIDVLRFGPGIAPSAVALTRAGQDLVVTVGTSGTDRVTVARWFDGAEHRLESFRFDDGTAWSLDNLRAMPISVSGTAAADVLAGWEGIDLIDGLGGADTMAGGAGDDRYTVDHAGDTVVEVAAGGIDTVLASVTHALAAEVEHLALTGAAAIDGTGNALANRLTGNAAANRLAGGAGDDTLDGGAGADTLTGGAGDDVYRIDQAGDRVVELAGGGTDTVQSSVTHVLGAEVEHLVLLDGGAIDGTGNALANRLTGNAAANRLDGAGGADTMEGGAGDDTYGVDDAGDVIVELADGGRDTVITTLGGTLADTLEHMTLAGTAAVNATGNAQGNRLTGNAAANVLDGGAGADTMAGGAGDDIYLVDDLRDVVTELAGQGTDEVRASVSWTLGAHVERLALVGDAAARATGNALANRLTGNAADNLLDGLEGDDRLEGGAGQDSLYGGAGNDTLLGGAGDDVYRVGSAGDQVIELEGEGTDTVESHVSHTLAAQVENLILAGSGAISGTGNELGNRITGNAAANVLDGGAGSDVLEGGAGNDTYILDSGGDQVIERAGEGLDWVRASFDATLGANLENLTLTGEARWATGNELRNRLTGNALGNRLDGRAGIDTLVGGAGDDIYLVDETADRVIELAGEGTEWVYSTAASWRMEAHVENLGLQGSGSISATGNALDNIIDGNEGDNLIDGDLGNDTLIGGAGHDTLLGNAGADYMVGGRGDDLFRVGVFNDEVIEWADEGNDTIESAISWVLGDHVENLVLLGSAYISGIGNSAANRLTGNVGYNLLVGGDGHDTLDGGLGADTLQGGLGHDTYLVDSANDVIDENADEGTDLVLSTARWYTLGANVENLTMQGAGSLIATGNALANVMTGNAGHNTLDGADGDDRLVGGDGHDSLLGGAGQDTMIGGAGHDFYRVGSAGDVVIELAGEGTDTVEAHVSWTLGDHLEQLVLGGSAALSGTGNALANVLTGNAAANTLDGRAGADTMVGGGGGDTYRVDDVGDIVNEAQNGGTDLVISTAASHTLRAWVENLTLDGGGDIAGTGNDLANVITGNAGRNLIDGGAGHDRLIGGAGDDTLLGGAGDDTMLGGAGHDLYRVGGAGDVVTELAGEGTDTVEAHLDWTLGQHLEHLVLAGGARTGRGNALDNRLTGNIQANTLTGDAGADTLDGGQGQDTLAGGTGGDTYLFGRNVGADLIVEDDATAGTTDRIEVGAGVSAEQLWLRRLGDDLELAIIGTADRTTVRDWYRDAACQVEVIRTTDGRTLQAAQVDALVSAMAAFAPPAVGTTTLPDEYQRTLAPLIATQWH